MDHSRNCGLKRYGVACALKIYIFCLRSDTVEYLGILRDLHVRVVSSICLKSNWMSCRKKDGVNPC